MIYMRKEGEVIRQGFNFYPRTDKGSVGCQMLFGPLRIEIRWSKRTKRFRLGAWLRDYAKLPKAECIYIPGQTEELKKLYDNNPHNQYWGKKYEDWVKTPDA